MRFLILTQYFPPEKGAAPTRLAATARGLRERGHEVEIVTAMPNYPDGVIDPGYQGRLYCKETWEGCTVHRYWLYAAQGKGIHRLLNYVSFALICCFGIFRAKKPDWIFVNSGPLFLAIPAYIASRIWRVPYIFNVADLWPESIVKIGATKNRVVISALEGLETWAYRKARIVTGVTQGIINVLINQKNVPKNKICFLPNGVDTQLFRPKPASAAVLKRHSLDGKCVLIYPGTHGYAHALERVLEAAELLREQKEVVFLFVGGGSEKPNLIKCAQEAKLDNVIFVDSVQEKELAEYISVARCGLIHQRNTSLANETRPAKALPMMAMGKPLIYAGFGEGAEIVSRTNAGTVIPPENPEALRDAVLDLLQTPEKYSEMGSNGRQLVENEFAWNRLIGDWLNDLETRASCSMKPTAAGVKHQSRCH